jgi:hypothetical protein
MTARPSRCRDCGAEIRLIEVVPLHPKPGPLKEIPLDVRFDPATSPVPPSHAITPRGNACHPVTPAWPVGPEETPALTHFATCPRRRAR